VPANHNREGNKRKFPEGGGKVRRNGGLDVLRAKTRKWQAHPIRHYVYRHYIEPQVPVNRLNREKKRKLKNLFRLRRKQGKRVFVSKTSHHIVDESKL